MEANRCCHDGLRLIDHPRGDSFKFDIPAHRIFLDDVGLGWCIHCNETIWANESGIQFLPEVCSTLGDVPSDSTVGMHWIIDFRTFS
jgi:hypothetical protein